MSVLTKYANAHTAITTGYTNPTNAYADDGTNYATAAPGKNTEVSAYWGFPAFSTSDIPDGSTINSVLVKIEFKVSVNTSIAEQYAQVFVTTTAVGTEQSNLLEPTTDTVLSHSVTTGVTLANLRTADVVRCRSRSRQGNSSTAVTFSIDYVSVTVDYTPTWTLAADPASLSLSGSTANFASTLTASPASLSLAGSNVAMTSGEAPAAPVGFLIPGAGLVYVGADSLLIPGGGLIAGQTEAETPTEMAVTQADLTLAGQSLALNLTWPVAPASLAVAGQSLTFAADLPAAPASLTLVGSAASFDYVFAASPADLTLAGQAATFSWDLSAVPADLSLSGQSLDFALTLPVASVATTFAGQAIDFAVALPVGAAELTLAGQTVGLEAPSSVTITTLLIPGAGIVQLGDAALLIPGAGLVSPTAAGTPSEMSVAPAQLTVVGQTVQLELSVIEMAVSPAALTLVGQDLDWTETRYLDVAVLTVAGQAAALNLTTPVAPASLTVAGQAITTAASLPVSLAPLTLTGQAVAFNTSLATIPAGLSVTGQTTTFAIDFPVAPVTVTINGQSVEMAGANEMAVTPASLTLAGQTLTLEIVIPPLPIEFGGVAATALWFNGVRATALHYNGVQIWPASAYETFIPSGDDSLYVAVSGGGTEEYQVSI